MPTVLTANGFRRTGYVFSGWNTAANGTGTAYADGATYPLRPRPPPFRLDGLRHPDTGRREVSARR